MKSYFALLGMCFFFVTTASAEQKCSVVGDKFWGPKGKNFIQMHFGLHGTPHRKVKELFQAFISDKPARQVGRLAMEVLNINRADEYLFAGFVEDQERLEQLISKSSKTRWIGVETYKEDLEYSAPRQQDFTQAVLNGLNTFKSIKDQGYGPKLAKLISKMVYPPGVVASQKTRLEKVGLDSKEKLEAANRFIDEEHTLRNQLATYDKAGKPHKYATVIGQFDSFESMLGHMTELPEDKSKWMTGILRNTDGADDQIVGKLMKLAKTIVQRNRLAKERDVKIAENTLNKLKTGKNGIIAIGIDHEENLIDELIRQCRGGDSAGASQIVQKSSYSVQPKKADR